MPNRTLGSKDVSFRSLPADNLAENNLSRRRQPENSRWLLEGLSQDRH